MVVKVFFISKRSFLSFTEQLVLCATHNLQPLGRAVNQLIDDINVIWHLLFYC